MRLQAQISATTVTLNAVQGLFTKLSLPFSVLTSARHCACCLCSDPLPLGCACSHLAQACTLGLRQARCDKVSNNTTQQHTNRQATPSNQPLYAARINMNLIKSSRWVWHTEQNCTALMIDTRETRVSPELTQRPCMQHAAQCCALRPSLHQLSLTLVPDVKQLLGGSSANQTCAHSTLSVKVQQQ